MKKNIHDHIVQNIDSFHAKRFVYLKLFFYRQAQSALGCLTRYAKKCLPLEERTKFTDGIAGPSKVTMGLCTDDTDFRSSELYTFLNKYFNVWLYTEQPINYVSLFRIAPLLATKTITNTWDRRKIVLHFQADVCVGALHRKLLKRFWQETTTCLPSHKWNIRSFQLRQ